MNPIISPTLCNRCRFYESLLAVQLAVNQMRIARWRIVLLKRMSPGFRARAVLDQGRDEISRRNRVKGVFNHKTV